MKLKPPVDKNSITKEHISSFISTNSSLLHVKWYKATGLMVRISQLAILLMGSAGLVVGSMSDQFPLGLLPILLFFAVFALVNFFVKILYHSQIKSEIRISDFANKNGFVLNLVPVKFNKFTPMGMVYGIGHSNVYNLQIHGELDSINFSAYNYVYVTGSGKNQQVHSYLIFEYKLKKNLPHIIIDNVTGNWFKNSLHSKMYSNSKTIRLESEFGKKYAVIIPDDYHIDVMSYLAPDLMEKIMKYGHDFDIECFDNKIVFYRSANLHNIADSIYADTTSTMNIVKEFIDNTDSYRDHRVVSEKIAHDIVHTDGMRLKRKHPSIGGLVALVVIVAIWFIILVL